MFKKADLTKQRLYEVALKQFAAKGFDKTTMRAIAQEAGVRAGAIYYHFDSKEDLVFEYYQQSHADHHEAIGADLEQQGLFAERLKKMLTSKIEAAEPYKEMARALFRVAGHPDSPLSPFSKESKGTRDQALEMCRKVVEGSTDKFHPEVKDILPEYLWMYQMGVILFWIYDKSEGSKKTFELIDKTVPVIEMLNQSIQSPMAAPFRKKILNLLTSFRPDLESGDNPVKEDV